MPQYNLTGPEREIVVSWLFEQVGYLDVAGNNIGDTAREALMLNPSLDVTVWIRTQTIGYRDEPFAATIQAGRYIVNQPDVIPLTKYILPQRFILEVDVTVNDVAVSNYSVDWTAGVLVFSTPLNDGDIIHVDGRYQVFTDQRDWDATGMVWWIWKHNGVNVTPPQRPPESALWVSILQEWAASIDRAFLRVDSVARNANTVGITSEDGTMSTMPAGTQLIHQRGLFDKVISVLQ